VKTISEVAQGVLEVMPGARFWVKGSYSGGLGDERHCVEGARRLVVLPAGGQFAEAFQRVASEQFPGRHIKLRKDPVSYVVGFNDHPDTRYADVRLILEKLAAG